MRDEILITNIMGEPIAKRVKWGRKSAIYEYLEKLGKMCDSANIEPLKRAQMRDIALMHFTSGIDEYDDLIGDLFLKLKKL